MAGAKDEQIARFPGVMLAFSDNRDHDYVVITGTACVSNDMAKIKELWVSADKAWWDSADDPVIRVIIVEPDDAEIWKGPNPPDRWRQASHCSGDRRQGGLRRKQKGRPHLTTYGGRGQAVPPRPPWVEFLPGLLSRTCGVWASVSFFSTAVALLQPTFDATERIAAHSDARSRARSRTIRTARSRSSAG